jgi:hypothetical protein
VRALRLDVDGVDAGARRHEEAVPLRATKADVGADLGQKDLADALAVLAGEDVDTVVARTDPAGARPDVAVDVAARMPSAKPPFTEPSAILRFIEVNSRPFFSVRPSTSQTLMLFGAFS